MMPASGRPQLPESVMVVFSLVMAEPQSIPLASPPCIAAIDVGTFAPADGRYSCAGGQWRMQLHLSPAVVLADRTQLRLTSGCATIWPPETALSFTFDERLVHACSHFTLSGPAPKGGVQPIVHDLGSRFDHLHASFLEAVDWADSCPERAQARLWDLLWDISAAAHGAPPALPLLARSQAYITRHLHHELSTPLIAEAAGCSSRQLLRIFRAGCNRTVTGYVRAQRVEAAVRLLRGTQLPLGDIAVRVGLPDPHLFNKTIQRELGMSPSMVRSQGQAET
jgi:AraC-like DNA-binding protein